MTLAIPTAPASFVDRIGDAYNDVVQRLRIATDEVMDARPMDGAINAVAGLIGHRHEVDDLLAQIESLQQEITLLQRRDASLSKTMRKLDEEQRLAARIQQDFLPKSMPAVGALTFQALFRPAHYVSGDLYDVKRLDETHVGIYLADAVGHGMPAALLTMFMKNALATKRITDDGYRLLPPSETLATLNNSLRSQGLNHASFATALYARVNCETNELCFARGGHPDPILIRADGTITELTCDGPLLGIFDDGEWAETCVTLQPGDRVMFYTDGVEVAFAGDISRPDTERWRRELAALRFAPTAEILAFFSKALDENIGVGSHDDLTIVFAEVGKSA